MPESTEVRAYTIRRFCAAYSISPAWTYELIKQGKLRSVRIGGRRLIPADAAEEWLRRPQLSIVQGEGAQP